MRIEQKDGSVERMIATAAILDQHVLAHIADKWEKEGLLRSSWANWVVNQCVRYFKKYGKPPAKAIRGIFSSWASNGAADKDAVKLVEKFLEGLSDEYQQAQKEINSEYVVDLASEHINTVRLERLAESIQGDIDRGKAEEAVKKVQGFAKLELGSRGLVNVLKDKSVMREALTESVESLIKYPGALGKFFGDSLARDQLVAFEAMDKAGKSFWLIDIACRAMEQRRKVLMFQCGDLSRSQIMRRLMTRFAGRPLRATGKEPIKIPTSITRIADELDIGYEKRRYKSGLTTKLTWQACQQIMAKKIKSQDDYFYLSCHYTDTLSMNGINAEVDDLERKTGWVPDVVIIDYADILAPIDGRVEHIHQINKTWMAMRGLAMKRHCLVVTATQSSSMGYTVKLLSRRTFSGSKTKNAHASTIIGINVTDDEMDRQYCRLNKIFSREEKANSSRPLYVAGCLALARPAIKSTF